MYYIWYDKYPSESSDNTQLTGHITVYTQSTNTFNVFVQKNGYLSNSENFTRRVNAATQNIDTFPVTLLDSGHLNISKATRSTNITIYNYQVFSTAESTSDPYAA